LAEASYVKNLVGENVLELDALTIEDFTWSVKDLAKQLNWNETPFEEWVLKMYRETGWNIAKARDILQHDVKEMLLEQQNIRYYPIRVVPDIW